MVIGGSTGIGLAIAEAIMRRGVKVLVTGTSERNLEDAKRRLAAGAHVLASDTTRITSIEALASASEARLGKLDAVFLNAGFCKLALLAQVSEEEYDRTFANDTKGAFFTVQKLAPLMRTVTAAEIEAFIKEGELLTAQAHRNHGRARHGGAVPRVRCHLHYGRRAPHRRRPQQLRRPSPPLTCASEAG